MRTRRERRREKRTRRRTRRSRQAPLRSSRQHPSHPARQSIECITCLADDVPVRKSAKLDCTHRICHDCLKRVFKLSVTDPQLMPPKCCSDSPIPLKHVDRLFDTPFKRTWNKKFAEYTTKNRLYCPTKHCGEWIKPKHISHDRATRRGRGTCPKCRRDVCKPCGQKWHGARDCTADPATLRVLEIGREHGWQRCYNCKALVQLAEGCNHMKCRCAAEFCMLCGLQWKSCDCPWFNLPEDNEGDNGGPQPAPPAPPAPPRPQRERAPGAPLGPLDVPDIWRPFEMLRPRARWAQMGAANAPDPAAAQRDDEALARQVQAMEIGAEVTGAEAEALTLGDEAARRRRRRARTRRNAENDLAELMGGDGGSPSGERSKRRPVSSRSNGEATQHRRRR
ncbi:hypothetical protein EJ06DRAFT_249700 [Trichodelitschia bisporula]|uniref:RBR-type E3 ubiquitin transferase n=1 Tax=Trichodelitschia bisporula TaxID=703511 RepID=A0A6G1HJK6_9PEZI|nr:hypothetical protein EJ06DRAFT_249700 [Trichodelitschia bisporula]